MSSLLTLSEDASGVRSGAPATVRRTACYLPTNGQAAFAWLHEREQRTGHGVLICPPIGYEQIHSHRALRHLADSLATAGFLACRFDYEGTGDSPGRDEDPNRAAAWLANIHDAIRWLRETHGCKEVSVIGVRLGGLLAMKACAEVAVANLVLWAPVVKGRQYVREADALAMASGVQLTEDADVEAAGFVLTRQTAEDLSRFDAFAIEPRCRRTLIVARDDSNEDRRLLDHLVKLDIEATQVRVPGYADMMAEPHLTKVPRQAIGEIVVWLSNLPVGRVSDPAEGESPENVRPDQGSFALGRVGDPAYGPGGDSDKTTLVAPGTRERIVTIGGQPELVGVLSEPLEADGERPMIVLVNAGAAYRVGPNRLYVLMARQLAAEGFRCLRVDLTGLGDSVAPGAARENDSYAAELFPALDRVLEHAETSLGARRFVLAGLCSGAYVAFQAAAQFSNPALVESVLINPLTFFWRDGMTIESPDSKELMRFHYYSQSALQPAKWWKLLTGQSRIGVWGAIKMVANRMRKPRRTETVAAPPQSKWELDAQVSHPAREDVAGDLGRIAAAGRQLACFFSRQDPGASILNYHARRTVNALCRAGKLNLFFVDNADHTFSRRERRETVIADLVRYLRQRYAS